MKGVNFVRPCFAVPSHTVRTYSCSAFNIATIMWLESPGHPVHEFLLRSSLIVSTALTGTTRIG